MSIFLQRPSGPGFAGRPGEWRSSSARLGRAGLMAAALITLEAIGFAQDTPARPTSAPPAVRDAPGSPTTPAEVNWAATPSDAEVAAQRAEAAGQLQAINPPASAAPRAGARAPVADAPGSSPGSAADQPLRALLQERLRLLEEYERASSAFLKADRPEPSPERQAQEARSELARLQALLAQAAAHPEALLPPTFGASGAGGKPPVNAEMKEAIEAATGEWKEWRARLEALRAEATNWEAQQNARRAERDKLFRAVVAMKAQGPEKAEPAGSASPSAASLRLARERQVNTLWNSRVAARRLQAVEAQIALEAKLVAVREVAVQVGQAQVEIAGKALELLQARYSAAADRQERLLKEKAAAEENTANRSDDPLERFRARRRADLLDIEAKVVKHEEALATSPSPSLDEQRSLADRATDDFAQIRQLLDDGRVSRLDAIRLNNDFRRIGPERDRLLRNELAIAEARLQYYEDALTAVELELLQDSLHDRFELESLREGLPPGRWAEAEVILAGLERGHRALLDRRRKVLEQLADRTAQTLDQIARRLAVLDEEYAFIRTHIFWVRDREPIGPATIAQGARECQHLVKALLRMAQESARPRNWGRPSAEFLAAALAALGLPLALLRLRRILRARLARELAAARPAT
jgi:hypothetical protein